MTRLAKHGSILRLLKDYFGTLTERFDCGAQLINRVHS